jgi:hypothetical protein
LTLGGATTGASSRIQTLDPTRANQPSPFHPLCMYLCAPRSIFGILRHRERQSAPVSRGAEPIQRHRCRPPLCVHPSSALAVFHAEAPFRHARSSMALLLPRTGLVLWPCRQNRTSGTQLVCEAPPNAHAAFSGWPASHGYGSEVNSVLPLLRARWTTDAQYTHPPHSSPWTAALVPNRSVQSLLTS